MGEGRLFDVLKRLPDDCVVYYESGGVSEHPAFIVICPDIGLVVIKQFGWRASQIVDADETRVQLAAAAASESNPVSQAREFLRRLVERCKVEPGFDLLLRSDRSKATPFVFPVGYAAVLPNITERELRSHPAGDFVPAFPSSHVIARDDLVNWYQDPAFGAEHINADFRRPLTLFNSTHFFQPTAVPSRRLQRTSCSHRSANKHSPRDDAAPWRVYG
jgi:hypothetical protein